MSSRAPGGMRTPGWNHWSNHYDILTLDKHVGILLIIVLYGRYWFLFVCCTTSKSLIFMNIYYKTI